jgi:hypothetical protein
MKESESELLKIDESESEVLCTDYTALGVSFIMVQESYQCTVPFR